MFPVGARKYYLWDSHCLLSMFYIVVLLSFFWGGGGLGGEGSSYCIICV